MKAVNTLSAIVIALLSITALSQVNHSDSTTKVTAQTPVKNKTTTNPNAQHNTTNTSVSAASSEATLDASLQMYAETTPPNTGHKKPSKPPTKLVQNTATENTTPINRTKPPPQPPRQKNLPEFIVVKKEKFAKNSTYQTVIQPAIKSTLIAPIGGKIVAVSKQYGSYVEKNETLMEISSNDAKKALMESIGNYIQTKDSYLTALTTVQKNRELKEKGVVSDQELRTSESNYITALISLVRARIEFKKTAEPLGFDWKSISNINLQSKNLITKSEEVEKTIEDLLSQDYIITIKSEDTGVILPKASESDKDRLELSIGSPIKKDQTIGIIAEPNKLTLTIDVPEVEIVNLKKDQPVEMIVPILDNTKMYGNITHIQRFQQKQSGGKLPTIPAHATINCEKECHEYYGISAQATILNESQDRLQVPLTAVFKENETYYVKLIENNQIIKKEVVVGETTVQGVNIKSGLNEGDQVVKNYKATKN